MFRCMSSILAIGCLCLLSLLIANCAFLKKKEPQVEEVAVNRVLRLDGNGDYMDVGSSANLMFPNNFTLECWVRPAGPTTSIWGCFISRDAYPLKRNYWFGQSYSSVPASVELQYLDERGVSMVISSPPNALPIGEWTHCAVTIDANLELVLYINGNPVRRSSDTRYPRRRWNAIHGRWIYDTEPNKEKPGDIPATPNICTNIGASATERGGNSFCGLIDEVRIWNVALTQEEIRASMNARLSGGEESLVGYWNFDDGTPNDLSHNGNDGILFGDAQIVEAPLANGFIQ